ncbi:MAG TPA: hypothetical protein DD381_00965 [Lentisphaeria bacterium]|nr:hypothetical protein [Lentisphaeria bacterium]
MNITIETLWKLGKNKSEISRSVNHDWKTVSKVVESMKEGKYPEKKPHPKQLDIYRAKIIEYLKNGLTGRRVFEELRTLGSKASYSAVKDYISEIRRRQDICVRFHTAPGEESQVDFGDVGLTRDNAGKKRETWVFRVILGLIMTRTIKRHGTNRENTQTDITSI